MENIRNENMPQKAIYLMGYREYCSHKVWFTAGYRWKVVWNGHGVASYVLTGMLLPEDTTLILPCL